MAKEEIKSLIEKVGNIIELPQGETPTIATVTDLSKLRDQPFFSNAKLGDKVLVYAAAKKAFLYRPSTDKIIEVGPVSTSSPTPTVAVAVPTITKSVAKTTPTPTPTRISTVTLVLYNGTKVNGLTKTVETKLKEEVSGIEITGRDNAKGDYVGTLVVDISGDNKTKAQEIADAVGGEVATLPSEETEPNADILVILGEEAAQN